MNHLGFLDIDNPPKLIDGFNFQKFENEDTSAAESIIIDSDDRFYYIDDSPFVPPSGNETAFYENENVDLYLDKVYLDPEKIEAGFITEDLNYDVRLFSLYRENRSVLSVDKINFGGAILQHPVTPFVIPANGQIVNNLTILKGGPPFQDSRADYNIDDSRTLSLEISGRRIVPFLYEPNFDTIEENYFFETVKYSDDRGNEQRRSVSSDRFRLDLAFNVEESGILAQKLQNDLYRYVEGVVGVPFFTEAMRLTVDPQASQTLSIEEDISYFYALKNICDFVLIKNLKNDKINEVKEIVSVDDILKEISVASVVSNSFDTKYTVVYPILICYLDSSSISRPTEDVLSVSFRFKEYV